MKKKLIIIYLLLLCSGIDSIGQTNVARRPLDIFAFVDKSQSVHFNSPDVSKKCIRSVRGALSEIGNCNDHVYLYYIHKNTGGASAEHICTIPAVRQGANNNNMERKINEIMQQRAVRAEKEKIVTKLQQMMNTPNDRNSQLGTDILGVLEVVCKKSDAGRDKRILMLTDGIQDTKAFCKVDPHNIQDAATRSSQDLARIPANYSIQKTCLANARAQMVLPFSAIASTHNKFLDNYWENIFKFYGMSFSCE